MRCPICGGRHWIGHQLVRMDVIVDENNNFEENIEGGIYDSETPYGPYNCANCGHEVDELEN